MVRQALAGALLPPARLSPDCDGARGAADFLAEALCDRKGIDDTEVRHA